jgi:acetyl esterase/lipase
MYFYFKQGLVMLNTKFKFNFKFTCAAALSLALLGGCNQNPDFTGMKPPAASSKKPMHADVAYANASKTQKLDVYLPEVKTDYAPVVLMIHGGGFKFGEKNLSVNDDALVDALLKSGYAVVPVNYRLSGEAPFPAAVQDVKATVRYIRANAAQYGLNPNKIIAFGASAGGNLASMLGTSGDVALFDDAALGNVGVSSRVQGVIDWFGPTDFTQMDAQAKAQGCTDKDQKHNDADSFESLYLGKTVPEASALAQQANPITYVDAKDPPFLLEKGAKDCQVPIDQSQLLHDALKKAGVPVQLVMIADTGHGGAGFSTAENVQKVMTFVNAIKP